MRTFGRAAVGLIVSVCISISGGNAEWIPYGDVAESGLFSTTYSASVFQGELYVGGYFTYASGHHIRKVARWDGDKWNPLGEGVDAFPCPDFECNGYVFALASDENYLYVGGYFPSVGGGLTAPNIARWDGTQWSSMGSLGLSVHELVMFQGDVIAIGGFTTNVGLLGLARWDGSSWTALGANVDGYYQDVIVWNDQLVVSGSFSQIDGVHATNVAVWDGVTWSPLGDGLPEGAGKLGSYMGEPVSPTFMYVDGVYTSVIAHWTGAAWLPLMDKGKGPGILDLVEYNGDLFVGGQSSTGNYIAAWNGTAWSTLDGGVDNTVRYLCLFEDELVVLGDFKLAGGQASDFIARWRSPTPVTLSDFSVSRLEEGTHLSWQLAASETGKWSGIDVQRSEFIEGPYVSVSGTLGPMVAGEFLDLTALADRDYWYRILARGLGGQTEFSRSILSRGVRRQETQLYPPVPDGAVVRLHYRLADRSDAVSLGIFDVRGRLVEHLRTSAQSPGDYHLAWGRRAGTGTQVSPGVYFARLGVGPRAYVQKFVLTSK